MSKLSLRKVLEDNNKDEWLHISYETCIPYEEINDDEDGYDYVGVTKCNFGLGDNGMVYGYGDTNEKSLEQACRQYIIENGFKLEWFNDRIKEVFSRWSLVCDVLEQLSNTADSYEEDIKLIAWIYANDVKIVE